MQPFPDHHVGTLVGIMLIIVLLLFWAIYRMERKYKTERRQKMELPQWVFDEPQPGSEKRDEFQGDPEDFEAVQNWQELKEKRNE